MTDWGKTDFFLKKKYFAWFSRFCFFSWKGVSLWATRTKNPKEAAQVVEKRRWRPLPSNEGNVRWPNDVVSSIAKTWRFGATFFLNILTLGVSVFDFFFSSIILACGHRRTAKQCRERWVNHLRPDIRKGCWTEEEDAKLIGLHAQQRIRHQYTKIAEDLGRSGIDVRNRIYSTQRMVRRYLEGKPTNNIRRHGILFVSCYTIFFFGCDCLVISGTSSCT